MQGRYRIKLNWRILLLLSAVATFSTGLALTVQERTLAADLHHATLSRVEGAADSTQLLIDNHLDSIQERYRAVSGTPQFRANLEVGHAPTLRYYAQQLARRDGTALIAFLDRRGQPIAAWSNAGLEGLAAADITPGLLSHRGVPLAAAVIPLRTADLLVGELLAIERIDPELVDQWSDLCGAQVSFVAPDRQRDDVVERVVHRFDDLELRVGVPVDAEREALSNSRSSLLAAGGIGLVFAFGLSLLVSRGLVRPILQIQNATVRIGRGDFTSRLESRRGDEIGDVARAVDVMLDRLVDYRSQVEDQRRTLEDHVDELRKSQKELADAQSLAHIGSWHFDFESRQLWGSDELRSIFEMGVENKPLEPQALLRMVHPMDRAGLESAFHACITDGATLRLDCRISLGAPSERILHVQSQMHRDPEGRPTRLEGTVQDVTDRKRSEEQIRYLAHHDNLTGLGNRMMCRERLDLHIIQARREGLIVGVLNLGLDRFKRINDTLGHSLGDELLKGVADRLVHSLRETRTLGQPESNHSISRHGGDEFTVIVVSPSDVQNLASLSRRILDELSKPFSLAGHEVVISGSIGIAAFPFDGENVESLLQNTEAAMYHAKGRGRNNYQFYAESMNEVALRRLIIENKMRRALESDEFELHYQPKVSLATGLITGVEALIRWRDPEQGMVLPGIFIPIAEETGLIAPMGEWVLRSACNQIAAWSEAGFDLPVSINLSTHQFRSGDLAARIMTIQEEAGAKPELVELEITESALMHDESAIVADLETLRARGMRISVDDFGTGYSSFAYLRRLPVDALKIDRSFVMDISENADDAAVAASIVNMAKALRLDVIAEGVENEEQRTLLEAWGCDEMQGYLFSPARPPEEIEAMLREERRQPA